MFPALLALAGLAFAQGWPGASLLYHVPGLNLGAPARAAVVCWVAWAWLAALGAEALLDGARRARAAALAVSIALSAAAAIAIPALDLRDRAQELPTTLAERFGASANEVAQRVDLAATLASAQRVERALIHVAWAAAGALLTVGFAARRSAPGRRSGPGVAVALGALVAVEGLWVGWPHMASCAKGPGGQLFPPSEGMAAVKAAAADGRVLRLDASTSGVDDVLRLARPNLPQVYGIADPRG